MSARPVLEAPERILLGPGPSNVPARVLAALSRPTVGYLDSSYTRLMEALQRSLRDLFRTTNEATFAITGSGTAAMEAAIANVIEPGDKAVACVHGYFADRMRQILERVGADVTLVEGRWGEPIDPAAVEAAVANLGGVKAITVVHGETSTGVRQSILPLGKIARAHDALLIVDTVASLGGAEFASDEWLVDVAYTGSQKCLSVPPGISPITFGPRAMAKIRARRIPCCSWYLDAVLNMTYWESPHRYHHTGPINLTYALFEGLQILEEEGLAARIQRTRATAEALWAGVEAMELNMLVAAEDRLPTLNTIQVPSGVDEARVRAHLMNLYGIEIAGGLGALVGKTWRVGLMGYSCQRQNVLLLLAALEHALRTQGHLVPTGEAVRAAADKLPS